MEGTKIFTKDRILAQSHDQASRNSDLLQPYNSSQVPCQAVMYVIELL